MQAKKTPATTKAAPRRAALAKKAAASAAVRKKSAAPGKTASAAGAKDSANAKKTPKLRARLVRDSFTMPEPDFALIAALKARALAGQREAKKSELLRAGLHALMALDSSALIGALGRLQPLKVGRPKKGH